MRRIAPVQKELMQRRAGEGEMRKAALQAGMRPLVDDALAKVLQGLPSPEEVVRVGPVGGRAGAPCAVPAGRAAVKKPRVLVVDDDEDMRKIIRLALTKLPVPVDVEAAADGLEALDAVQRARPDLVIADLMMPGMDGFALCQKLREDIATTFVPIMMLTAHAG